MTFDILSKAFGESTMSRKQVQLWYNRFKKGWEDVNDDARATRTMKTFKQWRKWFLIIVESLLETLQMMLAYRLAHEKYFLRMFQAAKIVLKLLKF